MLFAPLSFFASSAQASITHPYTGMSFGPGGVGSGSFGDVVGVAVSQASGDVFVLDAAEGGRVYKFDAAGEPVDFASTATNVIENVGTAGGSEEQIAVDSSSGPDAGDIYVADNDNVEVYSAAGILLNELSGGEMCGVAVDPSGNVYVGVYPETVRRYTPVTNPVTNANSDQADSMGGLQDVCNVAADREGNVYAATYSGGVTKYGALEFGSLSASGTTIDSDGRTLAVEPASGDVLIDEQFVNAHNQIAQYDGSSEPPSLLGTSGASGGGALRGSFGVGIDDASGRLYVGDEDIVEIFGPGVVLPDAATEPVSAITSEGAVLHGTVAPEGTEVTACVFEFGTGAGELTNSVPCTPTPPITGSAPVGVTAQLSSLPKATRFYYRLAVTGANGTVHGGEDAFRTAGPEVSNESFAEVGVTSVEFGASIAAPGEEVTYSVEYGTTTSYGTSTPLVTATLGSEPFSAQVDVTTLQPDTVYDFRFVATSAGAVAVGPNLTFTTYPPTAQVLPDGRGYEKVTPSDNDDGDVYQDVPIALGAQEGSHTELPYAVSLDGSAVTYPGDPSEKGGVGHEGAEAGNQYVARRASDGDWTAVNVDPASTGIEDVPVYQGFSADLSEGILTSNGDVPLAPGGPSEGYAGLYKRAFGDEGYASLLKTPPHRSPAEFGAYEEPKNTTLGSNLAPEYAGSSADFSHVLFAANDTLTEDAIDGGQEANNLYDSYDGALALVNVLPDGAPDPNATFGGPVPPPAAPADNIPALEHDIADDGSRIFWTDLNTHDLYVRENDMAPQSPIREGHCAVASDACTILIAEGAQFWNATPDGSKVLYSKGGDLYEYDLQTTQSVNLAPGAELQGVVSASEGLSYVYFVGDGAIAPGATKQSCDEEDYFEREGEAPLTAGCNLYVVHLGESPRFIAALSNQDIESRPETFVSLHTGDWVPGLGDKEAEATPDGLHLLFVSHNSLTGFANDHTEQIYVYDFAGAQLSCVSCAPTGETAGRVSTDLSAYLPVSHQYNYLPHWISDDGNRVFFDSLESLVPQDINRKTDVYEWERDGFGSCGDSPGCIYLISDGTSNEGSYLIGSTPTGNDVFFTTRGQLVREDENENTDIYDARVGAMAAPVGSQCGDSGCQGVPSAPPVFATPASTTFNGVGNFESAVTKPAAKPLTRAQKLAKQLKACRRGPRRKRASCEAQARRKYRAKQKAKPTKRRAPVKKGSE